VMQCGYADSDAHDPDADWVIIATR